MTTYRLTMALGGLLAILLATTGHAQENRTLEMMSTSFITSTVSSSPWTAIGSSGTIDDASVPIVALNGPTVTIKNAATFPATATLRYNVVALDDLVSPFNCLSMSMRFRDNGPDGRVRMFLKRLELATGTNTLIAALNSNDSPPSGAYQVRTVTFFPFDFDFSNFAYYVEVRLIRSTLAGKPGINVLQIGKEEC